MAPISGHEIGEDQILRRIVGTYRKFLVAFGKDDDGTSVDEIRNEIDSHKEWVVRERSIFHERMNETDLNYKTKEVDEVLKINMSIKSCHTNHVYISSLYI